MNDHFMHDPGLAGCASLEPCASHAQLTQFIGRNDCPPDAPLIELLRRLPIAGVWRAELDTGLLYWSPSVFDIYGFAFKEGPINFARGMDCYHPDDRDPLFDMIDQAVTGRHGFSSNLRIRPANAPLEDDRWTFIRAEALYHVNMHGVEEIYGSVGISDEQVSFIRAA